MLLIESLRVENKQILNLSGHLERMFCATSKDFSAFFEKEQEHLSGKVLQTLTKPFTRVKCRVLYDASGVKEVSYTNYKVPQIKTLKIVDGSHVVYPVKNAERSALDKLYTLRQNADDILIVSNEMFTDSYFCNLIFENAEGFFTPSKPLLCGTHRARLLSEGMIQERDISLFDFSDYTHVRLINAMLDWDEIRIPIASVRI